MTEPAREPSGGDHYSPEETRSALAWIARHMQRENQSVFLIEHLQPSWLATRGQRLAQLAMDSVVIGALTGLIFFISWFMSERLDPPMPEPWIPLWLWIVTTAFWSLVVAVIDDARLPGISSRPGQTTVQVMTTRVARAVVMVGVWAAFWFVLRALFGDGYAAFAGCGVDGLPCASGVSRRLPIGRPLVSAGYLAVIYGVKIRGEATVKPVEALGWSWVAAVRGLLFGALAGVAVWIIYATVRWSDYALVMLARNLLLYPPLGAAGGFVIGGLSVRVVREKSVANQGIRLSLRNALFAAGLFAFVLGLVVGPVLKMALPARPDQAGSGILLGVVLFGIVAALVGFAWFGGREVIMHASLRAVLSLTRQTPRNLVAFLDHCVELDFLRKVGGGYVFIHRYLLEYFADLDTSSPATG